MTSRASGGVSPYPSDVELLADERYVVAAVMVEGVRPPIGTRGKPPQVSLRVDELIRGKLGQQWLAAVWLPPDYLHGNEDDPDPQVPLDWLAAPLAGPTPGARLIVLISQEGDEFRIAHRCRFPDSPQMRSDVRKWIARYIVDLRAWKRQTARDARAERAGLDARRRSWRTTTTPLAIARSARDADFIGIGRSAGSGGFATFEITSILKGIRRKPYIGSAYFADVEVPRVAQDLIGWPERQELLLFLTENGMNLDMGPAYPLAGIGLVIADAEARKVVQDTLAQLPHRSRLPLCVVMTAGYAGLLSGEENLALKAGIADTFAAAGKGRCTVGKSSAITGLSPPEEVGDKIRELFLGASRAVLVSIGNDGNATLSGIRIGPDRTSVTFSGESWPKAASDQRITARRLLDQLVSGR
jgi:hypothetical protein